MQGAVDESSRKTAASVSAQAMARMSSSVPMASGVELQTKILHPVLCGEKYHLWGAAVLLLAY